MRRHTQLFLGILAAAILSLPAVAGTTDSAHPAIKSGGDIRPLPDAALQPDRNQTYKALFSLTKGSDPKEMNDGLEHVARAVNIFASAGVPLDHIKFAVIFHGPATSVVLDDASYQKHFGTSNPNLKLLDELKAAGVQFYVCGQALAGMKYENSEVNPDIKVALSALSTIIIFQQQGYALVPM